MVQGFLAILAIILFVVGIIVLIFLSTIIRAVLKIKRMIRPEHTDNDAFSDADYFKSTHKGAHNSAYGRTAQQYGRSHQHNTSGQTHVDSNEVLYDDRDPNVAKRKIFTEDEGEYVDFEETKE